MSLFINFSIILGPLSNDFVINFRCFFSIDFGIGFVDFQGPKLDPTDNIIGQGASKNRRPLPTGPWVALGWRRRGRDMALTMVQAPFSSILLIWGRFGCNCLIDFGRCCRTTNGETTKRRRPSVNWPKALRNAR